MCGPSVETHTVHYPLGHSLISVIQQVKSNPYPLHISQIIAKIWSSYKSTLTNSNISTCFTKVDPHYIGLMHALYTTSLPFFLLTVFLALVMINRKVVLFIFAGSGGSQHVMWSFVTLDYMPVLCLQMPIQVCTFMSHLYLLSMFRTLVHSWLFSRVTEWSCFPRRWSLGGREKRVISTEVDLKSRKFWPELATITDVMGTQSSVVLYWHFCQKLHKQHSIYLYILIVLFMFSFL